MQEEQTGKKVEQAVSLFIYRNNLNLAAGGTG